MNKQHKEVFAAFERLDSACGRLHLRAENRVKLDALLAEMRHALLQAHPPRRWLFWRFAKF